MDDTKLVLELPLETLLATTLTVVVAQSSVLHPGGSWDARETAVFDGAAERFGICSAER